MRAPPARLDTFRTVETPEGIALTLRPAGLVPRALAYAIDLALRLVGFITVAIVLQYVGDAGQGFMLLMYFGLEWFYPVVFELGRAAATPGQRLVGLRVVMDSGLPVTPAASITRNLLRAADFMPMFYAGAVVSMLCRDDSKRLGDLAAGTLVVHSRPVQLHGALPDGAPRAPSRPLSAGQQTAVLAWAGRSARLTPERVEELAALVSARITFAPVAAATALLLAAQGTTSAVPAAILSATAAEGTATQRLLGVAHWLLGARAGAPRP
jgi:uncharacterized RDD family membrane protein YckC